MNRVAALLQSLAANRALVGGNKPTAFVATAFVLRAQRPPCAGRLEGPTVFDLVLAVATRELDTVQTIAVRLKPTRGGWTTDRPSAPRRRQKSQLCSSHSR